jgi:hypothetical protein
MGKIERMEVPKADREKLEGLVRDRITPQKVVRRTRIALFAVAGVGAVEGLLKDATRRRGRKPLTPATTQKKQQ